MALQDSGVAETPTSDIGYALSESQTRGSRRANESDCEDGDHATYPSQESSTDSTGSSLVVGPQPRSPPTMHRESASVPATARSDASRKDLPLQAVPATITVNEPNSFPRNGDSNSPVPCSTPNGAATVQYINVQVQQATDCPISFTGKVVGSDSCHEKQSQGLVQTDGQVAEFSCEFGALSYEIMAAVKEEKKEGPLLSIAADMTYPDPNDRVFPGAESSKTIEEFFELGRKRKWWHWLDFDRLLVILERSKCKQALEIMKAYMKKLGDHVTERLSVLEDNLPKDEGHWVEMKCQCDAAGLQLQHIKKHKEFLTSRLKVFDLAFTYCDTYAGCIVTVWRIHSAVQAEDVKRRLLAMEGCSKTVEPGKEVFKATLYTPFPDLFARVVQGTLDVDTLTEAHLSAVNDCLHTLLSLAVECNKPCIVEKLLEKGLSQKTKDFRATEMGQTAVNIAAYKNHCACLKALLVHGCDPTVPDVADKVALQYACSNNCVACVREICTTSGTKSLTGLDWIRHFLDKPNCFSEEVVRTIEEAQARRQCEVVTPVLFEAARSGDFSPVILEEGDTMNVKSEQGEWPLYVAALHGHLDVMKTFKKCGRGVQVLSLTDDGSTILHAAVLSHNAVVVRYALHLMDRAQGDSLPGSDVNARNAKGESALELASRSGNLELMELLLRSGAHPCVPSSCGELVMSPHEAVQKVLVECRKTHWLKIYTAMNEKKSPLKQLTQFWQNPYDHNLRSTYGENMLMTAAREGKCDAVKFLLDSLQSITDEEVLTKFQSALPQGDRLPGYQEYVGAISKSDAKSSSPVLQKYLLMVDPHDGHTAAHCAAASGKLKSLICILECNLTCVGIQDKQGNTPLHIAAIGKHTACIKELMERASHVDVNIRNKNGQYADELLNQRAHFWTLRGKLQRKRRRQYNSESLSVSRSTNFETEGVASDDMAIGQRESCQNLNKVWITN